MTAQRCTIANGKLLNSLHKGVAQRCTKVVLNYMKSLHKDCTHRGLYILRIYGPPHGRRAIIGGRFFPAGNTWGSARHCVKTLFGGLTSPLVVWWPVASSAMERAKA